MVDLKPLMADFTERYGTTPRVFSAPGRVNLIGEHTDYNDGFVLPMAIDRRTYVAIAAREDRRMLVSSIALDDSAEFGLDRPEDLRSKQWANYAAGVAWTLQARGLRLSGADLMIDSEVPIGAGLSSSAALEVATGVALITISDASITSQELSLAAQQAEREFAGANVGVMDQLAATMGRKQSAMLIDCRSLEVKQISLANLNAAIVVCNTNVKHDLAASAYNQRRAECEEGVELLQRLLPGIRALRDVSVTDFQMYERELPEPIRRRCRHVVTENERTLKAAEALERGDHERLGELMRRSHESLTSDYEVSCRELDTMVEIARRQQGTFGARMTGGGFGGCTVNIVSENAVESFSRSVTAGYLAATAIKPEIYVVKADEGAREEIV